MRTLPLGASRDDAAHFPLDRSIGIFFLGLFVVRFTLTSWMVVSLHSSGSITPFEYVEQSWWVHARYLAETATEVWLGLGLIRGRRWGMVGLVWLYLAWLGTAAHGLVAYGPTFAGLGYLLIDSLILVYAAMRLTGGLGARPKPAPREETFFLPDRIAAWIDFVFIGISLILTVRSTAVAYHGAQDMGAIALLPYLGSRWWIHCRYVFETLLEAWTIVAIGQSRRWALFLMTLLSTGWLFGPIRTGNVFYIVTNGLMLVYCLVRLFGLLKPRNARPAIVSG